MKIFRSYCLVFRNLFLPLCVLTVASCSKTTSGEKKIMDDKVHLVTVDPGHFHAALVQKSMYSVVDSTVHVYAPDGPDVRLHLDRIENFNKRNENPTNWNEEVYTGADFFEKMLKDDPGNVVVLAGNNEKKTEYISRSLRAGFNVLADKPMVIDSEGFDTLVNAFKVAAQRKLLLYDIMTERFEITTLLQREFSMRPAVFGTLKPGTVNDPSVTKESVHHFYKYVSGQILTRPPWFMDVKQAGEGIVDVTTHLVDLVQWECFPEQMIDYSKDITIGKATRSATKMSLSQFKAITKLDRFPSYLQASVQDDSILSVYSNGSIDYKIKDIHAHVSVIWNYMAPEGAGDTHYSIMKGTKANLIIQQGAEQKYKPTLYIEPVGQQADFDTVLAAELKEIQTRYPGIELSKTKSGWEVIIPDSYKEGHEAHFSRVMEKFLEYLREGNMPAWEVPNMLAKYYTTTKALEKAVTAEVR